MSPRQAVRARVRAALGRAVLPLLCEARPLLPEGSAPAELWSRAFAETYRTERRAERGAQAPQLYHAFTAGYDRVIQEVSPRLAGADLTAAQARRRWRRRRALGKFGSVLRLLKASFTFEGGSVYLVSKVGRHSSVTIDLTLWQRRHPILASSVLAWRLYRAGGFR